MQDNIAAATLALTAEDIATLDDVSKLAPEHAGWMLEFTQRDGYPANFG